MVAFYTSKNFLLINKSQYFRSKAYNLNQSYRYIGTRLHREGEKRSSTFLCPQRCTLYQGTASKKGANSVATIPFGPTPEGSNPVTLISPPFAPFKFLTHRPPPPAMQTLPNPPPASLTTMVFRAVHAMSRFSFFASWRHFVLRVVTSFSACSSLIFFTSGERLRRENTALSPYPSPLR